MAKSNAPFVVFNGGEIGEETLDRVTLENYAACSELLHNVWVDSNGPMCMRPGWMYRSDLGSTLQHIRPFIRSVDEKFLLVFANQTLRVAVSDGDIIARPAVTSSITNGTFETGGVENITNATLTASSTSGDVVSVYNNAYVTVTGGAVNNLKDTSTTTHWMSNTASTAWVKIDIGSAYAVDRLNLTSADTFGNYAPISFQFQASTTGAFGGEQVNLLTVSGAIPFGNSETRRYSFTNATAYRYYRLYMTATATSGAIGSSYTYDVVYDENGYPISSNLVYVPGSLTGYFRLSGIGLPNITGWTDISTSGGSVTISGGTLKLNSNGAGIAGVRQQITTSNANTLHALDIIVHHGPVMFKCGSSSGSDSYIAQRSLATGYHSLAFTPPGDSYWIEMWSIEPRQIEVDSIAVASAGDMVLTTPWITSELKSLRTEQSLNVAYVSIGTVRQRRIERWDNNSWSITITDERDGPFDKPNTDRTLTITPTVRSGNGSLVASKDLFKPGHVGALFRLTQAGQFESYVITGAEQWSEPVQVQGVGGSRAVTFTVGSGLTATVRLQRSIGNTSSWADATTSGSTSGGVTIATTGSAAAQAYNDGLDNNNVYYRVGVNTGQYTSGSSTVTIYYPFASTEGIVRITNYSSSTSVSMEVLENLSTATATFDWEEGSWSDYRGWPRAMGIFDGRLWALRDDKFWGSYSDAYESHERDDGASSAIARAIAVGAANKGQWMMPLGRLIIGTEGAEVVVRSNAFDEPLSTTNMTVREMSTYGVGDVQPIKVDTRCLYVDSSSFHLMEIVYNVQIQDYIARPLTTLHRDVGRPGIIQLTAMRRPDTRVAALKSDGDLLIKLFDPQENVLGWARWSAAGTNAAIESIATLPSKTENQDQLFAVISRTIGGTTKYYLEELGPVHYDTVNDSRTLDSCVVYSGASTATITGLSHLNGQSVYAWADGYLTGPYTVSGGQITLGKAATNVIVGLKYEGSYKSVKLAFGAQAGTALAQRSRPSKIAFMIRKALSGVIEYGYGFGAGEMHRLPDRKASDNHDAGPALVTETTDLLTMPGRIAKDPRVCIRFSGPGWINGFVVGDELNERVT